MPRGRVVFKTRSPRSKYWPGDPAEAMREIAGRHNASYIEDSLVFSLNGDQAEALFKTEEDEEGFPRTRFYDLGYDLDALELRLYVDQERWLGSGSP